MSKMMLALFAVVVLVTGCAANKTAEMPASNAAVAENDALPEIAPYEEMDVEPLPDMVPAELM
jgi:hypothetical protein